MKVTLANVALKSKMFVKTNKVVEFVEYTLIKGSNRFRNYVGRKNGRQGFYSMTRNRALRWAGRKRVLVPPLNFVNI